MSACVIWAAASGPSSLAAQANSSIASPRTPCLHQLRERFIADALAQGVEPHVAAHARRKIGSVLLPERSNERVPALLPDFPVVVAGSVVQTDLVSNSFRWPSVPPMIEVQVGTSHLKNNTKGSLCKLFIDVINTNVSLLLT